MPPVPTNRPPSVDALARSLAHTGLPHPLLVDVARSAIADGTWTTAEQLAASLARTLLRPVVNATGVLLHTNLGRAPWATTQPALASNIELDLASGRRGDRHAAVGTLLARASGAEAAMLVNNGAAAVLLVLAALAESRAVAVSRGELVEIGGGFRIPDVMERSGARLIEVGTTNRTRAGDFRLAVENNDVAAIVVVHRSNFTMSGFTEDAAIPDLASLGVPIVVDLGSGLLDQACPWLADGPPSWLANEPAARQTLAAGADLVIFSGDKLLGGPQAGIIAGRQDLVERCVRHPLARALRCGGLVVGSMQELALAYLRRDGAAIPFWSQATTSVETLALRASALVDRTGVGTVIETESLAGGGTLPGITIPSAGITLPGDRTDELRAAERPVVARVDDNRTILDLRSVNPIDDQAIESAMSSLAPEV